MIKRMQELTICAIEQGYSMKFEGKIWIDLTVYQRLKRIYQEDLNNGR